MRIYGTGAIPNSEVSAQLVLPEPPPAAGWPSATGPGGFVGITITTRADSTGAWEFANDSGGGWPPPAGHNSELLNQTQVQAIYGVANAYWHIAWQDATLFEWQSVDVLVTGDPNTEALYSTLTAATRVNADVIGPA